MLSVPFTAAVQKLQRTAKTVGFVYDREKQEWKAVEGVNVTLGLPIIRASVDHGTDFYHAGKGNGNELSLVNAIKYAVKMTGRAN